MTYLLQILLRTSSLRIEYFFSSVCLCFANDFPSIPPSSEVKILISQLADSASFSRFFSNKLSSMFLFSDFRSRRKLVVANGELEIND